MMIEAAVVMGAINFASGFFKSLDESNQAVIQAAEYKQNAISYRMNARLARKAGAMNEDMQRSQNRAQLAQGAAAAGEAGMGTSTTTAMALQNAYLGMEQNVLLGRFDTESKAFNYLYQAQVADENARQLKKKSKNRFFKATLAGVNNIVGMK